MWSITPDSLIVSPAPDETIELSSASREIWGWAWADGGVRNVYVCTDDAATWRRAELERPRGSEWQLFSTKWTPKQSGVAMMGSLTEAMNGSLQTISGRRNAIYNVTGKRPRIESLAARQSRKIDRKDR